MCWRWIRNMQTKGDRRVYMDLAESSIQDGTEKVLGIELHSYLLPLAMNVQPHVNEIGGFEGCAHAARAKKVM